MKPKITGLLNNGALYAALPILLEDFERLATGEACFLAAEVIENYTLLQTTFHDVLVPFSF